ncbi:MAG: DUF3566 domain-containing protein [Mycobacteriales bacterium]
MTTLGFRTRPITRVAPTPRVPRRVPAAAPPTRRSLRRMRGRPGRPRPPAEAEPEVQVWTEVGTVSLRSATRYLTVWTAVLFVVLLLVLCGGYAVLLVLGVIASVSRALALVLAEPLPSSGVLPFLRPQAVLPVAVLVSAALSVLWLITAIALILVHNATSSLTGGLRVRLH